MPDQTVIGRNVVLLTLLVGIIPLIAVADEGSPAVTKTDVAATPMKPDSASIVVTGGRLWPQFQVAPGLNHERLTYYNG